MPGHNEPSRPQRIAAAAAIGAGGLRIAAAWLPSADDPDPSPRVEVLYGLIDGLLVVFFAVLAFRAARHERRGVAVLAGAGVVATLAILGPRTDEIETLTYQVAVAVIAVVTLALAIDARRHRVAPLALPIVAAVPIVLAPLGDAQSIAFALAGSAFGAAIVGLGLALRRSPAGPPALIGPGQTERAPVTST